ncbi:MAG: hypothetical protein ACYC7E_22005 [Armatimonadota bacterium]
MHYLIIAGIALLALLIGFVVCWIRRLPLPPEEDPEAIRFVYLLSKPRRLKINDLERVIDAESVASYGTLFSMSCSEQGLRRWLPWTRETIKEGFFPTFEGEEFLVEIGKGSFFQWGYSIDTKKIDRNLRAVIETHQGWISVGPVMSPAADELPATFRKIGRIMARLAGDDCQALLCPQMKLAALYHADLAERLAEDATPELLPILLPSMTPRQIKEERFARVRERWPEFVEAFHKHADMGTFLVSVYLTDEPYANPVMVQVLEIDGDDIYVLDPASFDENNPQAFERMKIGMKDIADWIYTDCVISCSLPHPVTEVSTLCCG